MPISPPFRFPALGPKPQKLPKGRSTQTWPWAISLHRRSARASEGPKTLENVSSERPMAPRCTGPIWLPCRFVYEMAVKPSSSNSDSCPPRACTHRLVKEFVHFACPPELFVKPLQYQQISRFPRPSDDRAQFADGIPAAIL